MAPIALITPPFTQLNTPYPATAYLKGFLNTKEINSFQIDLGIETILEVFSKSGLQNLFEFGKNQISTQNAKRIYGLRNQYVNSIDAVILFLQGKNPNLAKQICQDFYLPEANRFQIQDDLDFAFGNMGIQDKAKHLATLYLEDLSDFITECVDHNFGFSRYAERLGRSANSFDELHENLSGPPTYIDSISLKILENHISKNQPSLVCFSVPFPGNLYSAFKSAQYIKSNYPNIKTAMGGGFANTELREIKDRRVFDFFDFITLDDGELPIELLIKNLTSDLPNKTYKRTYLIENDQLVYKNDIKLTDYKQNQVGTPDYTDLLLDKYISVIEVTNPMHSLWTDGRWNKLTLAHGCYWGKCTFCDITLDYIKIYEPIAAKTIVDRMEKIIAETNETGFHFVDEAAPPSLMKEVAIEIIKRKLNVTWWTNIRFEKSFTYALCSLLRASGCIAVSGGLEVASDRLLKLIEKGVTVEQVALVCRNFSQCGIMVHSYLMYGYPTQTIQETIDSLEMVRQLFETGIIQSGFWHQFALTAHSPIGKNPSDYGIIPKKSTITFANNDVEFEDKTGINHDIFSFGLKKSLFNYMHGLGFEFPLQNWFDFKIPKTKINKNFIELLLNSPDTYLPHEHSKVFWLGEYPEIEVLGNPKQGTKKWKFTFYDKKQNYELLFYEKDALWLDDWLKKLTVNQSKNYTLKDLKKNYLETQNNFEMFWYGKNISVLRDIGLVEV